MKILKLVSPLMTGPAVKQAQKLLVTAGANIDADGEYGPATEKAVKVFQYDHHLEVDGEVGPATLAALQEVTIEKYKSPSALGLQVASLAKSKIGLREKPNNSGFVDSAFEKFMRAFGWFTGAAWCAFFARAIWLTVYANYPKTSASIRAVLGGSTIQSWRNAAREAAKPGSAWRVGRKPREGAIGYYQHTKTTGHAVVVTSVVSPGRFRTSEGNGNSSGGREGIEVATHIRSKDDHGFLGFVYPPNPTDFGDAV